MGNRDLEKLTEQAASLLAHREQRVSEGRAKAWAAAWQAQTNQTPRQLEHGSLLYRINHQLPSPWMDLPGYPNWAVYCWNLNVALVSRQRSGYARLDLMAWSDA